MAVVDSSHGSDPDFFRRLADEHIAQDFAIKELDRRIVWLSCKKKQEFDHLYLGKEIGKDLSIYKIKRIPWTSHPFQEPDNEHKENLMREQPWLRRKINGAPPCDRGPSIRGGSTTDPGIQKRNITDAFAAAHPYDPTS